MRAGQTGILPVGRRPVSISRIKSFEQKNGKIGAVALLSFLVDASRWLNRSYKDLEGIVMSATQHQQLRLHQTQRLTDGTYFISGQGTTRAVLPFLGEVTLKNPSRKKTVVMLELMNANRESMGFSYVRLGAGDTFVCKHNLEPVTLTLIVVGVVAAILGAVAEAGIHEMQGRSTCSLWPHVVCRDVCDGLCDVGKCHATETKRYWIFGSQDSKCSC